MYKKLIPFILLLFLMTACSQEPSIPSEISTTPPPVTELTEPTVTIPTEAPTMPPHSDFYIPGVSVDDVILYFNEVCLDAEFTHSGDPGLLQKWISPIAFYLHGNPTDEDLEALHAFTQWLNTIAGFPGICQTQDAAEANLNIHFCDWEEMISLMGADFDGMDGAVTFWYMDNVIYDAIICCRSDLDQHLRSSVILEEIYNGLGPIQDTNLRPDSIIYAEYSEPQVLTVMDELILRLLYHPEIKCGMNAAECETVIRQLYY